MRPFRMSFRGSLESRQVAANDIRNERCVDGA